MGISFTSFSPPHGRHPPLARKMSRFSRKCPELGLDQEPQPYQGMDGLSPELAAHILSLLHRRSCCRTLAPSRRLPPPMASHFQWLFRGHSGGHPQSCLPEAGVFSFQLPVKAAQNKLSPFHSVITVTLNPRCHLLLHKSPHLAKLERR